MTAKKMHITNATRYPYQDKQDTLELKEGVNVIVGELNTGKTKWLQMIDFVLGDNGKPEEAFDSEVAEKYESLKLTVVIGDETCSIERRWREPRARSKIFVNDEGMTTKQFSEFILEKLNIPIIHIPSGNPFADRSWPELSWREMFRHMYKQERFWSDFTQKQVEVVRSACILHFLNAATSLYPKEYGDIVRKKKEKDRLEAQKEVFVQVLQDVATEVVGQPEMTVAITPDSISEARQRLKNRLTEIDKEKQAVLEQYDQQVSETTPTFETAKNSLEAQDQTLSAVQNERSKLIHRHSELSQYAKALEAELGRFEKVKVSASVFADLKVTHCPACDQEVPDRSHTPDCCPVCGRTEIRSTDELSAGSRRVEFEQKQVSEELDELRRLIRGLEQELSAVDVQISQLLHGIDEIKRSIDSARSLSVRAIPPELAFCDQEVGKLMSQLQQLDRVERSLTTREEINEKIETLESEIATLDAEIKRLTPTVDFEGIADLIGDRMNTFLNLVNADSFSRWKTGRVSIKLRKDSFDILLDGQPWTVRAGGTAKYIIQISYHYALLSLSNDNLYNYPGFLIIDFPPQLSSPGDLRDSENYLLKPFVDLCGKKEMAGAQVIIAGRAFDNLEGANIIRL